MQVRPFTGRMSANSVYAEMTQVCWVGRLILKLKWRQTNYFFAKVDEERKVEAVKDFYENAVGNERVVERLQFISIIPA